MVSRIMTKKGALCSSLSISRRTSSASIDIRSFCIKGPKYFGEPFGICKSLSKIVFYLARSCMIERKLPLLSFESSLLDPQKGKLHFANIHVTFTILSKTFFQKFVFSTTKICATLLLLSPCFSIPHTYGTRLRNMCGAFMASNSL